MFHLAAELGVTSRGVLGCLAQNGMRARSASSVLEPEQVHLVRTHLAGYIRAGTAGRGAPFRPDRDWPSLEVAEHGPAPRPTAVPRTVPPEQVTAAEGRRFVGVQAATIRQWVSRGYLDRVGQRGRSALYDRKALIAVREEVRSRTPQPPLHPALDLPTKYDRRLVTAAEAAVLVGVARSTVRSWVSRGHLIPTTHAKRPHLFTVGAVLAAAQRRRRGRY